MNSAKWMYIASLLGLGFTYLVYSLKGDWWPSLILAGWVLFGSLIAVIDEKGD